MSNAHFVPVVAAMVVLNKIVIKHIHMFACAGVFGGFLGPSLVGWLVQRARDAEDRRLAEGGAAALHGGGFGVSAMVLGAALAIAGVLTLALGAWLGRLGPGLQQILHGSAAAGGVRGGVAAGAGGGGSRGGSDESAPLLMVVDSSVGSDASRRSGSGTAEGLRSLEVSSRNASAHGGLAAAVGLPSRP